MLLLRRMRLLRRPYQLPRQKLLVALRLSRAQQRRLLPEIMAELHTCLTLYVNLRLTNSKLTIG